MVEELVVQVLLPTDVEAAETWRVNPRRDFGHDVPDGDERQPDGKEANWAAAGVWDEHHSLVRAVEHDGAAVWVMLNDERHQPGGGRGGSVWLSALKVRQSS